MRGPALDLKPTILARMDSQAPFGVWTASDFVDAGARDAVDQALHRLTKDQQIRRLAWPLRPAATQQPHRQAERAGPQGGDRRAGAP